MIQMIQIFINSIIDNNVETYYFTQLKMRYLMTTFRSPSDISITSWFKTWSRSNTNKPAYLNQDVIKMSDGHRNVVIRYHIFSCV